MNARLKACLALMLTLAFNLESAVINQVSAQPQVGFSATPTKPKLVVMLVADKMPYGSLLRYQDKMGNGGLKFLTEAGANFVNCTYSQAATFSACGNATIATGAGPWANGIIADQWYDRRKGKAISCVFDENTQMTGANAPAGSSKLLKGTTIGDEFKLATNGRAKVISLAVSDSQAMLLGGRLANIALWFDVKTGNFVTSSQYSRDLPNWVKAYNDTRPAERYTAKPWLRLLPETQYGVSTRDDYTHERPLVGDGKAFPHVINTPVPGEGAYSTLAVTPMANQMVFDLAREAVEKESLGNHTDTDLLVVGLSAGDKLISYFGPASQEAQDLVLRMDQGLSGLLSYLDQKVGLGNCLIAFTASSGAQQIPEFSKERGLDGGRIDAKTFKTFLDTSLDNRLGADDWIESFEPPYVHLNFAAIDKNKYRQPDVEALCAKVAHSVPGIAEVITTAQLYSNQVPSGPYGEGVRRSYFWERSGELYVVPKPGFIFSSESNGTASGSPYSADAQVPMVLYGFGIQGGRYGQAVTPADLAPTIAALTGTQAPSLCDGKPLAPALAQTVGPVRPRGQEAGPAAAQ
ncbi:MAG TPA: alkaline phosphatase family protein [Candidatus Obscuribacter sp.]|nr:alkaline phosphatase family protein [Candidatus Obscuribacter sp.]HMY56060.1 alkaline phosphatase family protein [Candidatus Obscuribacter sp.]HNB15358.1 alkaline phosphatase family protein [Candidatus Obscuribacter sp.]HND06274.1 alkaline phosphatase family protein [Candidatus Obscuribacter sp.]HND69429.1 alkaline phosphatase family protein [Candidatus Obscuribacter sp.]